ncbi:PP2C family protein-serine/threonine phosphatase [Streptomyces sp. NPDC012623]|uniref:PP2C family protein-serine/threonine phosphatase n=1 Tax=unclassified Streptomyces TaxID=2593676 RepID=UPI0036995A07
MTAPTRHTLHSLPQLRRAVRGIGDAHRLPAETRARLVLSVAALAAPHFGDGRSVALESAREESPARDHGSDREGSLLSITLRTPCPGRTTELPLPARTTPDGATVWHIPAPPRAPGAPFVPPPPRSGGLGRAVASVPDETASLEQELRAALAHVDALAAEHRRLKHELAETNSGVLALYVQLEERDEQLRTAHGQMLRELEDALRPLPIAVDGLELAVHYAPAGTDAPTGGDHYDWFTLPDGTIHITVVDALGHGVRSTRSALNVTHAVRTLALEGHPLQSIVARTHEILAPFDPELMATVLLARLDPATGELRLANGSHPPALVVRADGAAEYLEVRGRGVGYPLPGSERLLRTRLGEGDLLVLYTDGLVESRRDPQEGERRLIDSARRHRNRAVHEIPGALAADMLTVVLHADDTLALAVRRTPDTGRGA